MFWDLKKNEVIILIIYYNTAQASMNVASEFPRSGPSVCVCRFCSGGTRWRRIHGCVRVWAKAPPTKTLPHARGTEQWAGVCLSCKCSNTVSASVSLLSVDLSAVADSAFTFLLMWIWSWCPWSFTSITDTFFMDPSVLLGSPKQCRHSLCL